MLEVILLALRLNMVIIPASPTTDSVPQLNPTYDKIIPHDELINHIISYLIIQYPSYSRTYTVAQSKSSCPET